MTLIRARIQPQMTNTDPNQKSQAYFIEIDDDRAGQRIDNFLLTHLKGVPKSRIYRIVRKGEVRVNKGRIRINYKLQAGDSIRIPPIRQSESTEAKPRQQALDVLDQSILYEDKSLLVLNKPSGMAVHGGSGISYGVIEAMRALRPDAHYLELVHRLDKDTSGCLLIAKKRSALRHLHELLRGGGLEKNYLALVNGRWQGGKRKVDAPLLKNVLQSGERIVRVNNEGKTALSIFHPVETFKHTTLVKVELKTGRTHQIRVHAAHIDHPIAMDKKYGDEDFNRQMNSVGLRRLFLHARSLSFTAHNSENLITVTAPLSDELENVLQGLRS